MTDVYPLSTSAAQNIFNIYIINMCWILTQSMKPIYPYFHDENRHP